MLAPRDSNRIDGLGERSGEESGGRQSDQSDKSTRTASLTGARRMLIDAVHQARGQMNRLPKTPCTLSVV